MTSPLDKEHVADRAVDRLRILFQQQSQTDYIGEDVSILEHSWQAYLAAFKDNAPRSVCIASLLHDVGHMLGFEAGIDVAMDGCGMLDHETLGGDFLKSIGLDQDVAWLVSNHVNAKRYLVWKDPSYKLSPASQITLNHQGGPMNGKEAAKYESHPYFEQSVRMRYYDEAAKEVGIPVPPLDDIMAVVKEYMSNSTLDISMSNSRYLNQGYRLSPYQLQFYQDNGYLVIPKFLPILENYDLSEMANDLVSNPGKDMLVHREQVDGDRIQICRVENFCTSVEEWKQVASFAQAICSELFNEPAVLFKDKLNYKLSGGGGFLAHQDATAYKPDEFASTHISVMVAIDKAVSDDVGPLQFVKGRHQEGVFPNTKGVINKVVEDTMDFQPLYVQEGDLVFFSSYAPHRSFANTSPNSRRLAYLTYNKLSEGNFHDSYYKAKLDVFRKGTGGSISINDDFAGKIVD